MGLSELPNYPLVNQLDTKTLDHGPNVNRLFNCVLCSILSAIFYFHPEWKGKIDADMMLDQVLPHHTDGTGTDALSFIDYAAKHGVKLSSARLDTPAQQIIYAHKALERGLPVICTEEDPYCNDYQRNVLKWTHALTWFKEVQGGLGAMDSFGGKVVEKSDAAWVQSLRGNVLWIAEKIQQPQEVPIVKIPQDWKYLNGILSAPGSTFTVAHGFADEVLKLYAQGKWNAQNKPMSVEYPYAGNNRQDFVDCCFLWNPHDGVRLIEGEAFLRLLWEEINHLSALVATDKTIVTDLQQHLTSAQEDAKNAQNLLAEAAKHAKDIADSVNTVHNGDVKTIQTLQDNIKTLLAQHEQDTTTLASLADENTKLHVQLNNVTPLPADEKVLPLLQSVISVVAHDAALLQAFKPLIDALAATA